MLKGGKTDTVVEELENRDNDSHRCSFIVENCFPYPRFLLFYMELRIVVSTSVKNYVGILMGITLNLFFSHFFIRYLAHLHFQCYTKSPPYPLYWLVLCQLDTAGVITEKGASVEEMPQL